MKGEFTGCRANRAFESLGLNYRALGFHCLGSCVVGFGVLWNFHSKL